MLYMFEIVEGVFWGTCRQEGRGYRVQDGGEACLPQAAIAPWTPSMASLLSLQTPLALEEGHRVLLSLHAGWGNGAMWFNRKCHLSSVALVAGGNVACS